MVKKITTLLAVALVSLLSLASPVSASVPDWDGPTHHGLQPLNGTMRAALTGSGYYYAGVAQTGVSGAKGMAAKIYVSNPYEQCNTGEHSVAELAAKDTVTDNVIEFGWIKDGCSGYPRLFTSYWKNGVWSGCFFACVGWQDNGSNPINLGADLTTVAAGCNGTTTLNCVKQFTFQYIVGSACGPAPNGVFFYYDGVNIGCFQSNLIPGTGSFDQFQAFGEVYYGGSTVPCTDMDTFGRYATSTASAAGSAFFGSITYTGTGAPTPSMVLQTSTDSGAYTVASIGSAGNRTFTFGGPGRTSTGGTPGNAGGC